ncbi:MAG: flagellar protein FlaG [Lachnospiraceae bacterium]|nr:flagellar protein FlaG [Lachnospiraceae bacterium]
MAIEPLGSMTAISVQATTKPQTVEQRQNDINREAYSSDSAVPRVDLTTPMVAQTAESNTNQNENKQQDDSKNMEAIKKAVDNLNKSMKNTSAIFGIHEATNRVTIKIVDKQTREVIKELPPEKTLDMISRVWELAGMLVDEKR